MTYLERLNEFNQWLESNPLPGNAQLLFFRLLNVFNRAGWPEYVRVDTLRLMLMSDCKTEKSARAARDRLIDAGFIGYEKGKKGTPNAYFLKNGVKKGCKNSPESDRENDPEIDPESDRENDRHIKTKKKTKTKSIPPLPPSTGGTGFSPELQAALDSWVAYKAEKRQAYKPTGIQKLISEIRNNAARYGEASVIALINECMANNWQGIIFDRLKKQHPSRQKQGTSDEQDLSWMQKYIEQRDKGLEKKCQ